MRAIIIADDQSSTRRSPVDCYPAPLLPLIDRPFIQHVVEYLVNQSVTDIDCILSHFPEQYESLLGDGARWGCRIRYHLARNSSEIYRPIKTIDLSESGQPIVLVHASQLPPVQLNMASNKCQGGSEAVYVWLGQPSDSCEMQQFWTGWAVLSRPFLQQITGETTAEELRKLLIQYGQDKGILRKVDQPLSVRSYWNYLNANRRVLGGDFASLLVSGKEHVPGIRLARNVQLHNSAILKPPVMIGENCRIGAHVQLGPNVVVGANSIIDPRCVVRNSVVLPESYVGENLELQNVIVNQNQLIQARDEISITVTDTHLLSKVRPRGVTGFLRNATSRLLAAAVLSVCWPIIFLTWCALRLRTRKPVSLFSDTVLLPVNTQSQDWKSFRLCCFDTKLSSQPRTVVLDENPWSEFLLRVLPGLFNVVLGQMRLVGLPPRSKRQLLELPQDWQEMYMVGKGGLITEAMVKFTSDPSLLELYVAESVYTANSGFRYDGLLLLQYFKKLMQELSRFVLIPLLYMKISWGFLTRMKIQFHHTLRRRRI